MPTLLIAAASAALLAALVTELSQRFWSGSYIALLVITFIALLVNGLFNARLRQKTGQDASAPATPGRQDQRNTPNNAKPNERNRGERKSTTRDNKPPRQDNKRPRSQGDGDAGAPARAASTATGPVENGTVKWFNRSKGYGFIVRENGDEIFVHQRSIKSNGDRNQRPVLNDGQQVRFVVSHQDKGAQAEQVEALD